MLGTSQIPLSDHNTPGPPHSISPQEDEDVLRRSWLLFDCILVSFAVKSLKYTLLECSGLAQALLSPATLRLSVFWRGLMNSLWSCPIELSKRTYRVQYLGRAAGFADALLQTSLKVPLKLLCLLRLFHFAGNFFWKSPQKWEPWLRCNGIYIEGTCYLYQSLLCIFFFCPNINFPTKGLEKIKKKI